MSDELWRRGAGELAGLIAAREVSSREVVEAHLARIDAVNPALNAVVRVLAAEALAAADAADRAPADGRGPLHGVPITVKENIDLAGTPTTEAVPALADAVSPVDAPVVERMRAAGAIPIGRTNLPDFGLRVHTDSSLHGLTRNPWDAGRTAGGSSGGEGSALASGMSPLGLGNDIGGSLRNPAHCCGIASIKPTVGRVPHANAIPPQDPGPAGQLMAVEGVMARRVADVRLGLGVVAGAHPRDPLSVPVPLEGGAAGPVPVALLPEPPGGDTHPEIAAAVRAAGEALRAAGHDVVEIEPPGYEAVLELWNDWLDNDLRVIRPLIDPLLGESARTFLDGAMTAAPRDWAGHVELMTARHGHLRAWTAFFAERPVIVGPVWAQPPFAHGWDAETPENAAATIRLMRPVLPANALGLPAAVVPGGFADGLPVGIQVTADRWQELLCLDVAETIERAVGFDVPIDPR